jgi:hypothetical protein
MAGYICAYSMRLIISSAAGENDPPDWPSFSTWWDDVIRPWILVVGTVFIYIGPAVAYGSYLGFSVVSSGGPLPQSSAILLALVVVGAFCLPMALLSVTMHDSFAGLNPVLLVAAIGKVFIPYLIACIVLLVVMVAGGLAFRVVPHVPILSRLLFEMITLYFVMLEMRVIGLIYAAHSKRLNWFDEAATRVVPGQKAPIALDQTRRR